MTELEELIQFWKDELIEGQQHHSPVRQENIRATIAHLENLKKLQEGE